MKAFFAGKQLPAILDAINAALKGRKLGEISSWTVNGTNLVATVSKVGTSTLTFSSAPKDGGTEVTLITEKLALAHRPFRDEVTGKLIKVVEQAGGKVTQA